MKTSQGYELIDAFDGYLNPEMLKEKVIFSDTFFDISKEAQTAIYTFCKCNCNNKIVKENLKQIRYAVTKHYFDF